MRSIIAILLTAIAAAPALAEQVNFTVTPPPGQQVTQIRIEPICTTCTPTVAPAPVVAAPAPAEPPKPTPPRKVRRSKCAGERDACNAQRVQLEADLATARAERDAARDELATCTATRDKCAADLATVGERITATEAVETAESEPAPESPPVAAKPRARRQRPARQQQTASPPAAAQGQAQGGARLPPFRINTAPATPGGNP